MNFYDYIAIREDWPKEGISFKDITPLLQDKDAFNLAIEEMIKPFKDQKIDKVICADARGFIVGAPLAVKIGAGLAIARKPNKLPYVEYKEEYSLEYGTNVLEIPPHAVNKGENVLVVDDLLATGGSAVALTKLTERAGGNVIGYSFLVELTGLKGKDKFNKVPVFSLIKYEL